MVPTCLPYNRTFFILLDISDLVAVESFLPYIPHYPRNRMSLVKVYLD